MNNFPAVSVPNDSASNRSGRIASRSAQGSEAQRGNPREVQRLGYGDVAAAGTLSPNDDRNTGNSILCGGTQNHLNTTEPLRQVCEPKDGDDQTAAADTFRTTTDPSKPAGMSVVTLQIRGGASLSNHQSNQ